MPNAVSSTFMGSGFVDLVPYQYGREDCAPGYSFGPARRNHFLFHYVISGKGQLRYTDTSGQKQHVDVHAGEGFMIFPGKINTYQADQSDPWHYIWIEFDGLRMHERLSQVGITEDDPRYAPTAADARDEMMRQMLYIVEHLDESPLNVVGHMYLFFDFLTKSTERPSRQDRHGDLRSFYISEAIEYIERHYQEDMTVGDIAANSGLDRSYLGSLFKASVGTSMQQYLMNYRMSRACELLNLTALAVSEVGVAVGYPNQMRFSRAFKNAKGVSPREWRKREETMM